MLTRTAARVASRHGKHSEVVEHNTETREASIGDSNVKLQEIYYDPKHSASYGSVRSLYRAAKPMLPDLSYEDVEHFLHAQRTYTTHRQRRKKFTRRRTIAYYLNQIWTVDLLFLRGLARYNSGFQYLLVVVDILSRQAYAEPMKKKNAYETLQAFKNIVERAGVVPKRLQADKGTEFYNKIFLDYLSTNNIKLYSTQNETKASIVERYIRSLKAKLFKIMTFRSTFRYIDFLQDVVQSLNQRYHRTIGRPPAAVTEDNQNEVFEYQFSDYLTGGRKRSPRFKVGDRVRISKLKTIFEKGYMRTFTNEIFTIVAVLRSKPTTYRIMDNDNEVIIGTFYETELVKVTSD